MGSNSNSVRSPLFHSSVDKLLNNWTALQLAILNGQGGGYGKDIALWMRGVVEDFFYQNADLMGEEVAEFIGEIMNNEFDTVVEDGSLEELGDTLCQHFQLARDPTKEQDLVKLLDALDAVAQTAKPPVAQRAAGEDSSDSSDDDDDEEMDTGEAPPSSTITSNGTAPHNHRAGQNIVTEPDEEGWVTVVKSKKIRSDV